jgi:hypothetical protein
VAKRRSSKSNGPTSRVNAGPDAGHRRDTCHDRRDEHAPGAARDARGVSAAR